MNETVEKIAGFLHANRIDLQDISLGVQALTHPSCSQEDTEGGENNQRLEFLGDAILDFVIGEYLYLHYPAFKEGVLTQVRAGLVCEAALYEIAMNLKLGDHLLLGKGEEVSGGRQRKSTLADALEALIGAIYLDGGLEAAREFILREMGGKLLGLTEDTYADYKSRLQEWVQGRGRENVNYRLHESIGPAHDRWFVSGVYYQGRLLAEGSGKTKKESEQQAAAVALELLKRREEK